MILGCSSSSPRPLAALLVWAPAAVAAEPATLEYNVEVPSTNDVALGGGGVRRVIVDRAGVAGETPSAVESPLESALGSVLSAPMALAVLAALGASAWFALGAAGRRPGIG